MLRVKDMLDGHKYLVGDGCAGYEIAIAIRTPNHEELIKDLGEVPEGISAKVVRPRRQRDGRNHFRNSSIFAIYRAELDYKMDNKIIEKAIKLIGNLYQSSYRSKSFSEQCYLQNEGDRYQRAFIALFSGEPGFDEKAFMEKCHLAKQAK